MNTERLTALVRQFAVGEQITLYEIDLSRHGGGVRYFTNNVFEERVPIKFNGNTYAQMPIMMDDVTVDSQGAPAQPKLSIATAGGPVASLLQQYNDLRGCRVTRYCTFAEFLDVMPDGNGGTKPNPQKDGQSSFKHEMFVIDRKLSADPMYAEFQLVAPTDQEGVMLPLRIVRKRWCDSDYRVPDANEPDGFFNFDPYEGGCPYRGTAYFDVNDQPTTKDKDRCSKAASGCIARFGKAAALPASMCPGIRAAQEA